MFGIFKSHLAEDRVKKLYNSIVEQARQPLFYTDYGVADTVDGRFDLIILHAYLVTDRLGEEGREGRKVAQQLFDCLFRDMDQALRELGVGDLSLPKHIKRMMRAFKGRAVAYDQALKNPDNVILNKALRDNLYRKVDTIDAAMLDKMAVYIRLTKNHLKKQINILSEGIEFKEISSKEFGNGNKAKENGTNNAGMVASI